VILRSGRPEGQADDLHAFRLEDLVEPGSELGVAVPEQVLLLTEPSVLEPPGQVARLSNAVPVGVRTRVAAATLAEVTQAM